MKIIVIGIALVILGWFLNLPEDMPQAKLDRYEKTELIEERVQVGGPCAGDKCLVVYVAPWCPACSALTPMINDLVKDLNREGVKATVIIGKDSMSKVIDYSKKYDTSVLEDANGSYYNQIGVRGVPYFVVINRSGKRISEKSGGNTDVYRMRAELDI